MEHLTLDAIGRELVISSGADPDLAQRATSLREVAADLPKPWLIGAHAAVSGEVDAALREHMTARRNWPASAIKREISKANDFERVAVLYAYTMVARDEHTHWNKYWPAIEAAYGDGFAESQTLRPYLTSCWEGTYRRSDERLLRPPRGGNTNRRHIRWPLLHAGLARGEMHRFARFVSWVAALEDIPVAEVGSTLLDRPAEQFIQIVRDWADSLAPHPAPARAQLIVDNPDDYAAAFMLQLGIATSMKRLIEALDEQNARGEVASTSDRGPVRLQMPTFVLDADSGMAGNVRVQIAGSIPLRGYLNASLGKIDFKLGRMHRQGGRRVFSDTARVSHRDDWWMWAERIDLEYRSEDTGEDRQQSRRVPPSPFRIDPTTGKQAGAMLFDLETMRLTHRLVPGSRIAVVSRDDVLTNPLLEHIFEFPEHAKAFDDHGFLRRDAIVSDPPANADERDELLDEISNLVGSSIIWTPAPPCRIEIRGPRDRGSRARRIPVLAYGQRPIRIVATNVQSEADIHVLVQSRGADATGSSVLIAPIVAPMRPGTDTEIEIPSGATTPATVRVKVGDDELAQFELVAVDDPPLIPLPEPRFDLGDAESTTRSIFANVDERTTSKLYVIGRAYTGAWIETFVDSGPVLRSLQVSSDNGEFAFNLPDAGTRIKAFDGIRWLPEINRDTRVTCSKISVTRPSPDQFRLAWRLSTPVSESELLVGTNSDMPSMLRVEATRDGDEWVAKISADALKGLNAARFFWVALADGEVVRVQPDSPKLEISPIRNAGVLKLVQDVPAEWLQHADAVDTWLDIYRDTVPGLRRGLMQRARLAGIKPVLDGLGLAAMNLFAGSQDIELPSLLERLPSDEFNGFSAWRSLDVTLTPPGFSGASDFERDGAPEAPLEILSRSGSSPIRLSWGQFVTHGTIEHPGENANQLRVVGFDGVRCRECNGVFASQFLADLLPNHGCDRIDHDPITEFDVGTAGSNIHAVVAALLQSLKAKVAGYEQAPETSAHIRIMQAIVRAAPHLNGQRAPILHVVVSALDLHRLLVDVLHGTGGDTRLHAFTAHRRSLVEPAATYAALAVALASIGTFPAVEWEGEVQ